MADKLLDNNPSALDASDSSDSESDFGSTTPLTAAQTPRTPRPSDLKVHHCPYEGCTKSFNRLSRLNEHERSHTGERLFKCQEPGCNKDFLRESHLKHHIKSAHTDIRDYVCNWEGCGKKFATGTRLRRHLAAHEGREKYRCRGFDSCNETFRKHATLTKHILTVHHGQKAFSCPDSNLETGEKCDMAFDTAEKLRAHQRAQHDPTRFSCTTCLDQILTNNMREDTHGEMEVDTSQAYFSTYALLQAHIADAHPPTCSHCMFTCSTQRELRRHIEGVHGILADDNQLIVNAHQCTYPGCTRSFSRKSNLNVHVNTVHRGQRAFICGETDLSTSKNLTIPFGTILESCGRSFTSKSSLEEHVRTAHLGMDSRQTQRKQKKRAAEAASVASLAGDDNMEERDPKRRKTNKKTKTTLANLTGVPEQDIKTEANLVNGLMSIEGDIQPMVNGFKSLDFGLQDNMTYSFPGYAPYDQLNDDLIWPQVLPDQNGLLGGQENGEHMADSMDSGNLDEGFGPAIDPLLLLS